ncbi:hypothetical protein GCM10027049_27020 [Mucilaginibacter puniceus]
MKKEEIQDDLASIRSLMERSSKFVSLSGLSGILAGVYALIGAAAAYCIMDHPSLNYSDVTFLQFLHALPYLIWIAIVVLITSVATSVILSYQKAKRNGQPIWGNTSKALLFHMAVPLLTGGLLILIFLYNGYFGTAAPAMLVFYGLALIGASNFTFTDIKYLGLCEIILGLIAACLPGYGLVFWAIGFGVLHIVYGSVMYLKYDK